MRERRILGNLERLVGARELEMDYRLMQRTNWRDLPRDIPLVRIEVHRYDTKGIKVRMGIIQTKTELTLEQTQQGVNDEVLIVIMDPVMQCTTLPSHSRTSERYLSIHSDDGNPSKSNIKQVLR
ncbi:hypothetical protein Tco_0879685 [Tanacetum coccineum]